MKRSLIAAVLMLVAGGAYAAEFSDLAVTAAGLKALPPEAAEIKAFVPGDILANYPGSPVQPIEWVSIEGGKFMMGTKEDLSGFGNSRLAHEVAVKNFEMSKTAVTVEQYAECVIKGQCTEPGSDDNCNWGKPGRQNHPVNCVNWNQAAQYAGFMGARLPSESEWEYAAKSGGKDQNYPWGNERATCDRAVMSGNSCYGRENKGTAPVCSRTAGNTAQGLCDMVGNVFQWVQDVYKESYAGAPVDGSAVEGAGSRRVMRGGSFASSLSGGLRADYRNQGLPGYRYEITGFRLAK